MGAARPIIGLVSLVILAAGVLFQFFIVLSGAINSSPENLIYFLQATTNGFGNSPRNPTRWAYFALCGADENGHNADCGRPVPALPFDPRRNFATTDGLPEAFMSGNRFYLLSRFAWVFYMIALVFGALALLTGLLALCSRLGSFITAGNATLAFIFQALAASLMTAWVIQGRNVFRAAGQEASIGKYAMGFSWASVLAFLINIVLYCSSGAAGRNDGTTYKPKKGGLFGRSKSTRSRGSFRDSRIKDDYS